jgi:hypothetical protein
LLANKKRSANGTLSTQGIGNINTYSHFGLAGLALDSRLRAASGPHFWSASGSGWWSFGWREGATVGWMSTVWRPEQRGECRAKAKRGSIVLRSGV